MNNTDKHHATVASRQALGREARKAAPRTSHGDWSPRTTAPTPSRCCAPRTTTAWPTSCRSAGAACRPRRSPSTAARPCSWPPTSRRCRAPASRCSSAATPTSSNFGLYGSPERELLFDVNDFDETLPGPFEWDLKRLAASFVLASRNNGFGEDVARETALAAVRSYREHMTTYAEMRELDVWYSHIVADELLAMVRSHGRQEGQPKAPHRPGKQAPPRRPSPRRAAATACRRPAS